MITWCCRCQEYTEVFVGSAIIRVLNNIKVRITNYSCDKCLTFKESIVENIPINNMNTTTHKGA